MLDFQRSLLTGVEASAAQNAPVTTICSQCGAVLPAKTGHCRFCDTSFSTEISLARSAEKAATASGMRGNLALDVSLDPAWRAELARRLAAYRARHRKLAPNDAQTDLPFEHADPAALAGVAVAEALAPETPAEETFAFTIAIGRCAKPARDPGEPAHMEIDVSLPLARASAAQPDGTPAASPHASIGSQLYPVAPMAERRIAAVLDAGCLLFAYGGFLTLFGSLGGVFTLSKLSAAVYSATIALFYLQYFALFTFFGGTTPGMMLRGLQVVSFSGEPPSPRQLFLRSLGYVLSAGSFFLGFCWTFWDEDGLTWHDRISHTYLTAQEPLESAETAEAARSH